MKKILIALIALSCAAAYAVDYTPVTEEVAATVVSLTSTGEVTIDGKYAVTGGDATTGLMVQAASVTATAATEQTNTFAVAFGAVPVVTTTYTEDPGDVRSLFIGTITTSNFICTVTADKNFSYVAVGARP